MGIAQGIKAKPSLWGVHKIMCCEKSLCRCSYSTPITLTVRQHQQLWQIVLPQQRWNIYRKLACSMLSSSSVPMLTCACIVSDGQQTGWSQAPSVYFCHHQCLSTIANNCRNNITDANMWNVLHTMIKQFHPLIQPDDWFITAEIHINGLHFNVPK